MNAHLFVYTRTKNVDYQAIISPTEEFCPKSTRKLFLAQARGVINIELYDDPFGEEPRWLLSKKNNLLLWGIGIQNKMLNEEIYKDFAGRPVRGFFGIIIDLSNQDKLIPYDINFFKEIYLNYIVPIWDTEVDSYKKSCINLDFNPEQYKCIKTNSNSNVSLNYDINKTLILGNVDLVDVLSSALSSTKDISIVSGFSSKAHAFAPEYSYSNAIVIGVDSPETKIHKQEEREQDVQGPCKPPQTDLLPKKVSRPVMLIALAAVCIVLLTIVLMRRCKNSNTTPSGENGVKLEERTEESKNSQSNPAETPILNKSKEK